MQSDPGTGAPVTLAPAAASLGDPRSHRLIPFEVLAAIAVLGAAAAGHPAQAAFVGLAVAIGAMLEWHRRPPFTSTRGETDAAPPVHRSAPACRPREEAHRDPAQPLGWPRPGRTERALGLFAAWFMPLAIAIAAAVLMRTGDVAYALTLLLVASPQPLLALPASSRLAARVPAAFASAALLAAALAGAIGLAGAALLQLGGRFAARRLARA